MSVLSKSIGTLLLAAIYLATWAFTLWFAYSSELTMLAVGCLVVAATSSCECVRLMARIWSNARSVLRGRESKICIVSRV
jgi:hypothetical protein